MSKSKNKFLELISGPMFAGKTSYLIQKYETSTAQTKLLFKPEIDTRYQHNAIVTHDGIAREAKFLTQQQFEASLKISEDTHIFIDEVQFFSAELLDWIGVWHQLGYKITVAGLNRGWNGLPIGIMPELIELAHKTALLQAVCELCNAPAEYTQLRADASPHTTIGEAESYLSVCFDCFIPPTLILS